LLIFLLKNLIHQTKELNRVRRAALTFGFYEGLDGLIRLLEREMKNINNQDTKFQLIHSINCLKSPDFKDYKKDIQPFITNGPFQ
jgi:hypothetical protein